MLLLESVRVLSFGANNGFVGHKEDFLVVSPVNACERFVALKAFLCSASSVCSENVHGVEIDAENLRLVVHYYLFVVYHHVENGVVRSLSLF